MTTQMAMHEWHDFFIVLGTAGATLLGLLFVAVTLNSDLILAAKGRHLKHIAEQAFQNFLVVVITSLLCLLPQPKWQVLGWELTGVSVLMSAWVIYRIANLWRAPNGQFDQIKVWKRLLPSLAGSLTMAYAAIRFGDLFDERDMLLVAIAEILLVISATATSWDLLIRVAEIRHRIAARD